MVLAFRRHTLLPLDDCLYALQPSIPHLTRSALHRCPDRTEGADDRDTRADLPEAWAGLTDAALEAASGVPGAKFCHNGRFIAVASKRDAIFQMADLAIAEVA